jgi:phage head maturation protease
MIPAFNKFLQKGDDAMSAIYKALPMEIKASETGNLVFKISTKSMDRDEDIMEPMGCDLTNYRANPVVLFAHNYQSPPIGKSIRESIYPEFIESEVEFAPTDFAQDCKKLCEGGFLNAASVGFNGIESEPVQGSKWGKHYTKWELLEWSVVPVPANAGSLIQGAKAKGLNLDAMEKELKEIELKEDNNTSEPVEKSGAAISSKNRVMLNEICENMKGCGERLRKFLDENSPGEPMEPPEKDTDIEKIKSALAEIKQVLSLCAKGDVVKTTEIDLEAIEYVKSSEPPGEPEMDVFKKLLAEKFNTYHKEES